MLYPLISCNYICIPFHLENFICVVVKFLKICFDHKQCHLHIWYRLRIDRNCYILASSIVLSWFQNVNCSCCKIPGINYKFGKIDGNGVTEIVVRSMLQRLLNDIKFRKHVESTLLAWSALFNYFYKTQELVFPVFVSPYFL